MSWLSQRLANISDEDIEWAESLSDEFKGANMGEADAARHLALGYVAGRSNMDNPGKKANPLFWIQGREMFDLSPGDLSATMDKHNNDVGFQMAALADDKEQARELILEYMKEAQEVTGPEQAPEKNKAMYYSKAYVDREYSKY